MVSSFSLISSGGISTSEKRGCKPTTLYPSSLLCKCGVFLLYCILFFCLLHFFLLLSSAQINVKHFACNDTESCPEVFFLCGRRLMFALVEIDLLFGVFFHCCCLNFYSHPVIEILLLFHRAAQNIKICISPSKHIALFFVQRHPKKKKNLF